MSEDPCFGCPEIPASPDALCSSDLSIIGTFATCKSDFDLPLVGQVFVAFDDLFEKAHSFLDQVVEFMQERSQLFAFRC